MGTYLLRQQNTYQITTYGSSTSALNSIGGTSEPFAKSFHSYIVVESQDGGISKFKGNLQTNEKLTVSGSLFINNHLTVNTSGTTVISSADLESLILVSTTSGTVTLQLPTTIAASKGRIYFIKKIGGTNTLTIDPGSTITIDGALTRATTDASASIQLISSGNTSLGYYIISEYGTWT
jgi:hypothetical protein